MPLQPKYTWVDGEIVNYTNWLNMAPATTAGRDNCAVISTSRGLWYASSNCFQKMGFICEADLGKSIVPNPSTCKNH